MLDKTKAELETLKQQINAAEASNLFMGYSFKFSSWIVLNNLSARLSMEIKSTRKDL